MDRRVEYMPLRDLPGAPLNPKRHDTEGIRQSIAVNGFTELPLLDERTGRLVAGHGRRDQLLAMLAKGDPPPDGVRVAPDGSWLVPVVRGWASRSDAHAAAYVAASNKLTENGGWDEDELKQLLLDADAAGLLALTGFDEDELQRLLHQDDPDPGFGDDDDEPAGWGVVVTVATAHEQDKLLQRLISQGYRVRTLAAAQGSLDG
jgi:hypothetical protein